MTDSDKTIFKAALDNLASIFECAVLSENVKQTYWQVLKDLSTDQFVAACSLLTKSHIKRWVNDFPLPARFLELVPSGYQKEFVPQDEFKPRNFQLTSNLVRCLLVLMPRAGKVNTDAEADAMLAQMSTIVDEEFQEESQHDHYCHHCNDSGFVYCWMQFERSIHYDGNEVTSRRVANSPYWMTSVDADDPMPNLKPRLTPCITRCMCSSGVSLPTSIPLMNSFRQIAM